LAWDKLKNPNFILPIWCSLLLTLSQRPI